MPSASYVKFLLCILAYFKYIALNNSVHICIDCRSIVPSLNEWWKFLLSVWNHAKACELKLGLCEVWHLKNSIRFFFVFVDKLLIIMAVKFYDRLNGIHELCESNFFWHIANPMVCFYGERLKNFPMNIGPWRIFFDQKDRA